MRKSIIIFLMMMHSLFSHAQLAFQKKDLFISAGLSGGNYRSLEYDASERAGRSVPIFGAAEYGINHLTSVGPFVGYYFNKYRYTGAHATDPNADIVYKAHYYVAGIKGTVHINPFIEKKLNANLNSEDLDIYVSGMAAYEFNNLTGLNGVNVENKSRPALGLTVGVRYFINYRIALFGEVGPGIFGLGSAGITARF